MHIKSLHDYNFFSSLQAFDGSTSRLNIVVKSKRFSLYFIATRKMRNKFRNQLNCSPQRGLWLPKAAEIDHEAYRKEESKDRKIFYKNNS